MAITIARFEPPLNDGLEQAIADFDCLTQPRAAGAEDIGEAMVRDFLRTGLFAQGATAGVSTTYLALDPSAEPASLLGYVTIAPTQIKLTGSELKNASLGELKRSDFGAIRIAMIGVDSDHQGRGVGKALLDSVVAHTANINEDVSMRFIVADALNTQLDWYRRQGFVENRSAAEIARLRDYEARDGAPATSVRLDLGPDPRLLLR